MNMKNRNIVLLLIPLLMMCLLTGCSDYLIGFESHGLPEGTQAYLLVKDDDDRYAHSGPTGTELENFNEDGWHYTDMIVVSHMKDNIKKYPSIRAAVLDENGKIIKISPEFDLRLKKKCYFWDKVSYNYETNEITGLKTNYYGADLGILLFNLFVVFLDILCFIIYMVAICRMNDYREYYLFLMLNIPNLIIIVMGGLWTFCGYFQAPDEPPNVSRNIKGYLFFIGFVCLVNSFGWLKYRRLKKSAASQELKE
jgi:hypothetical protein